ncbi:hypothetical protein Poly41_39440 [Novipirellula artificiosorum]|uniref:Keratin-like protein n=1 Tax=Novipirellula artificiosorum TaxID=2528016 RepID=A0A5C6DH57_9BACT|nr:hypothetical protein Poly41_39440 [Novipirellula artificiosorum]
MRRVFIPALLAVAFVASSSVNASAFGLFDKLCNRGCDSCCDVEPTCGCEAPAPCFEPTCGAEPCCDSGFSAPKCGLLSKLFHRHNACDACCAPEPTCGCEIIEPTCGCEMIEPTCGCEPVCCDRPSCGDKVKGFFGKLFKRHASCDECCMPEPTCGCEVAEPTCGCEW